MIAKAARLLVRAAGWLLTPIATIVTAALGALVGASLSVRLSPAGGLAASLVAGLIGATIGLAAWLRLLRRSPELRDVLAVTPEGVPTDQGIAEVLGPEPKDNPERTGNES